MASSQVEIASSSPFGCVLRDRNHREPCRECNVKCTHHDTFQTNIKNFVIDLNTCMAVSCDSTTDENNNNNNNNNSDVNNNDNTEDNNKNVNKPKAPKNRNLERLCFTRDNNFVINNNDETPFASLISPSQSRLLDRWAVRQARDMVSNLDNGAELLSMDNNDMLPRTSSSTSDESTPTFEIPNQGASSLVQMWEKRLNQSGVSKSNTQPNTPSPSDRIGSASSSSSPNATNESANSNANANANANDFSLEEQCLDGPTNEEAFPDWESSDQSISPHSRSERERVSVADLIRKLTATKQNQSPTPSFADENEHEGYASSSVTGSPCRERECGQQQLHLELNPKLTCPLKIRGRQAFNDLLVQMENDRLAELNNLAERGAVSKFAQRGRIQALLRLKLMQREVAANDLSRQKSTASEINNRQPQGTAIMQLRERFSSGAEVRTPGQAEGANARSSRRDNSATTDQIRKDTSNQTANGTANHATKSTQKSVSQTRTDRDTEEAHPSSDATVQETHNPKQKSVSQTRTDRDTEEAHPSSDATVQETHNLKQKSVSQTRTDRDTEEAHPSSDATVQETHPSSDVKTPHCDSQSEATTFMIDSNLNETGDRAETSNQENAMAKSSNDETVNDEDTSNQQKETVEEEASNQNYAESSYDDEMVEEAEEIDQNCDEINLDWISEISKPRSHWEQLRQAWYREMLETRSKNEDIRKLLERRTVSSFLSSDFRDRMDRLMESHWGTQTHLANSEDHEEDSEGLMAFLQERLHSSRASQVDGRDMGDKEAKERRNEDEEERSKEEEKENEDEQEQEQEHEHEHEEEHEESLISSSYHDTGDYSNRSSSWSYRDHEAGEDYSISPQPYQSQSFYQHIQRSPSTNRHSLETELMYDMRGQMEQLYHEIAELRKSIKGCMDMQMQLQQSMKQEVPIDKKEEKKCHNRVPKKGNCGICYEVKADAVFYRCGHICACVKCANELQWNSGKCPICKAKILDVVRVYIDG